MEAVEKIGTKTSLHPGPTHSMSAAHRNIPEEISIMQLLLQYSFYNNKKLKTFQNWHETSATSAFKQLEMDNSIYIDYINPAWIKEHILLPVDFIVDEILFHNRSKDTWEMRKVKK